jgi:ABC-2 type transport system ATP-binding protein
MIEVARLCKRFGTHTAVDDLSFRVEPGEVLGFLGPNGAGKSTTMKMIAGFLAPSSGSIRVYGHRIGEDTRAAQRRMGYLPEGAPLYDDMTAGQFLRFVAEVRELRGAERDRRLATVVDGLELGAVLPQRIETLSKGFKRRVGLAQALVHDPDVLILDEPTDGLDPNQKHQVRDLIQGLATDKIVIVSTHILEEVEAVCNRAMIIAGGRQLFDGTPGELLARAPQHGAVRLHLAEPVVCRERLLALPGVREVDIGDDGRQLTVYPEDGGTILPAVAACVHEAGWPVDDLHLEQGRLDQVFRQITRSEAA